LLYDFDVHDCFAVLIDERSEVRQRRGSAGRTRRQHRRLRRRLRWCARLDRLVCSIAVGASRDYGNHCCEEDRK
jgi:hypothetical protein